MLDTQSLINQQITDEGDVVFLGETFYGCLRFQKLIQVFLNYQKTHQNSLLWIYFTKRRAVAI